jgi:hypothetical protein
MRLSGAGIAIAIVLSGAVANRLWCDAFQLRAVTIARRPGSGDAAFLPSPVNHEFRITVPRIDAGSILVIGCSDATGVRHAVQITSGPANRDVPHQPSAIDERTGSQVSIRTARRSRFGNSQPRPATTRHEHLCDGPDLPLPPRCSDPAPDGLVPPRLAPPQRRAIVPVVRSGRIIDRPCLARRAAQHGRVAVFLDDAAIRDCLPSDPVATAEVLVGLCQSINDSWLPAVADWIGPVPDLDGDGCLSLIVSRLDDGSRRDEPPMLGCVRGSDFTGDAHASPLTDVIYLDVALLRSEDRNPVVVHELTHAAIYAHAARQHKTATCHQVPAWLNESLAHLVEQRVCGPASGFAGRMNAFASAPSRHPIVARDDSLPWSARRGGTRAAGTLFLASVVRNPNDARQLLDAGDDLPAALEQITGRAWEELLRDWSVQCVLDDGESSLSMPIMRREFAAGASIRELVHGTAFCVFECRTDLSCVEVTSDATASIQVTIIGHHKDADCVTVTAHHSDAPAARMTSKLR